MRNSRSVARVLLLTTSPLRVMIGAMSVPYDLSAILPACAGLPVQRFAPGSVLIAEGPAVGHLYILRTGAIDVLRGETHISTMSEPGAIYGEMSALLGQDHSATVRAATDVEVYRLDDAATALRGNADLLYHVATILARRLIGATNYLADLKEQFAGRSDHLGMVDTVLDALVQRQRSTVAAGPTTAADPRL